MEYLKIVASNINKLNKKIFLKLQAIKTNVHFSCTVDSPVNCDAGS